MNDRQAEYFVNKVRERLQERIKWAEKNIKRFENNKQMQFYSILEKKHYETALKIVTETAKEKYY